MSKHVPSFFIGSIGSITTAVALTVARAAAAQPEPPSAPPSAEPPPLPPSADPLAQPPQPPDPVAPAEPIPTAPNAPNDGGPRYEPRPSVTQASEPRGEEPEPMSEGRRIVVAYNTGFQWGLSPGVVFSGSKASLFLGLRLGYGFDTGKVILVPGLRLAGYFTDPNVYVGVPVLKLVYPIDRFAPFIEGGVGGGYVSAFEVDSKTTVDAKGGVALLIGGGFMVHFNWRFGLGVEASYQTITGTDFAGFGIGPILALGF